MIKSRPTISHHSIQLLCQELKLKYASTSIIKTLNSHLRGLEKENLRILPDGGLSLTPHPLSLGSALTHPYFTTDFSESLLEMITPTFTSFEEMEQFFLQLHQFFYHKSSQVSPQEILWSNSMPCTLESEEIIPIGEYGLSHIGMMKHIYRVGLAHRYGKLMQSIAGIHYNYSFTMEFWKIYLQNDHPSADEISACYFHLIRNFFRYSWILIYLYGASPAISSSFIQDRDHSDLKHLHLKKLTSDPTQETYFGQYATSLRMSDLGYHNNAQAGLQVSYNHVDEYIRDLNYAIKTPHPQFETLGTKNPQSGKYRQLNTHILQIENEFYASIRPKRVVKKGERPTLALKRGGVEYIEVRCIDLNPHHPLGIDQKQMEFIDTLLLFCLLHPSPKMSHEELQSLREYNSLIASQGRNPELKLDWAPLMEALTCVGEVMGTKEIVNEQKEKFSNVQLTPSAQFLKELTESGLSFHDYSLQLSKNHQDYFLKRQIQSQIQSQNFFQEMESLTKSSLQKQIEFENQDKKDGLTFEKYLSRYFL